jgi:hypothetical protein
VEKTKNVTQLFVVKNQSPTAGLEADLIADYTNLQDGEVCITDAKNVVLDATGIPAALNAFKLIGRSGTSLYESNLVELGKVKTYLLNKQLAEVQQVDYVGSNGTTGALDTIASNIYTIRLYVQGSTIADFMQQKIKEGFYKSNTAAASYTQEAVATGLYDSLVANFSREPEEEIRFGRINSGARTNLGTATTSLTFTKGSTTVTCQGDVDDATGGTALLVGEWIGAAVAVTTPLYKIVSIDTTANTLVIDRPFNDASAVVLDDAVGRIIAATALAANYGVKLSGIDRGFVLGKFKSSVVTWKTTIDFGDNQTTTVVESVKAYPGIGTYQQLASLEKELQADEYVFRSFVEGAPTDRAQVTGALYDVIVLEIKGDEVSGLGVNVESPKTIQIALEANTATGDDANTGIVTVLNAILVASWAVPGAVNQTPTA